MSCTRAVAAAIAATSLSSISNTRTTTTRSNNKRFISKKKERKGKGSWKSDRLGRRQCTMICATHILHLLFTFFSRTHLLLLLCLIISTCTIVSSSSSSGGQILTTAKTAAHIPVAASSAHQPQQSFKHINQQPEEGTIGDKKQQHQVRLESEDYEHEQRKRKNNYHDDDDDDHHQVHKLMSEQDLRRTFQVDSHDQVPEYEILKLSVNSQEISDQRLLLRKRRYNNQLEAKHQKPTNTFQDPQILQATPSLNRPQTGNDLPVLSASLGAADDFKEDKQEKEKEEEESTFKKKVEVNAQKTRRGANEEQQQQDNLNEIVMKMSTFGKDFKLRLKRNVDFQKRIKDMKMFMAESTKDGRLRYTEMMESAGNSAASAAAKQRRQKEDQLSSSSSSSNSNSNSGAGKGDAAPSAGKTNGAESDVGSNAMFPHIDSTYHDEDNLAALLIHHDRKTGQLQVDGTIGNDFVIKPMPKATIDALLLKRQQQQQQQELLKQQASAAAEQLAAASRFDRDRLAPTNSNNVVAATATATGNGSSSSLDLERTTTATTSGAKPTPLLQSAQSGANLERVAMHMHDDDPHDDDEMFLDEDEAIEMAAHLRHHSSSTSATDKNTFALPGSTKSSTNNTEAVIDQQKQPFNSQQANSPLPTQQLPQQQQQVRALSRERKWKKYHKHMARTQVPKPAALAATSAAAAAPGAHLNANQQQQQQQQQQQMAAASSSAPQLALPERARRHVAHQDNDDAAAADEDHLLQLQVSHHIVYRQRPSSESSSSEHQHSFMIQPGEYARQSADSMERLAFSFAPQKLRQKRHSKMDDENMIDQTANANQNHHEQHRDDDNVNDDADFAHDPMDGQFYLEPGDVTGFERAGYSDWSLIGKPRALPPYALNATGFNNNLMSNNNSTSEQQFNGRNNTTQRRFKRHLSRAALGSSQGSAQQVRKKRQAPDTVWPEVLLVVDYDSFLLHGGDSRDVKRYFVSFWNGVDLRYKLLVHPHIRISLAGMIVAKDRDATPYLERNRLRAPNADAVDAAGALTDMGKYLYREDRLPTYDLAVVITKLDMCRRRYEGGRCNRGTAGFAYVGGACVVNKRLEKVNSVAIIEDSGGFSGIIVAAHEVGHLLGCVHDGSPPPSYLGGPGATHCPWEEGYIMSDLRHTERGFRWSQCSVEQFKHFLNGETATCLYNYPHESQMLHRLLPGTMLSLDEQCKRDRGTNACFKDARVCAQLFCFDSASGYCVSYRPAAEGSPCGEGQVCRNGKCVGEIENIIPDYTHQSQTVVAAQRRPNAAAAHHSTVAASRALADNGLSASSTSTATSSPNSKLPAISAAVVASTTAQQQQQQQQLTSRMDTFPIDTPLSAPASTYSGGSSSTPGAYSFGGRYNNGLNEAKSNSNGLVLKRHSLASTSSATGSTTTSGLHQHQHQVPHHTHNNNHNHRQHTGNYNYNNNNNQHHLHHSTMKSAKLLSAAIPDYTVTHQLRQVRV